MSIQRFLLIVSLVLVAEHATIFQESGRSRMVGPDSSGKALRVVPFAGDADNLEDALLSVASSAKIPIGLERVLDGPTQSRRPWPTTRPIVLTGLTVDQALAQVLAALPQPRVPGLPPNQYRLAWVWGVARISAGDGKPTFLDMTIPLFQVDGVNIVEAVMAVHHLLDKSYSAKDQGGAYSGGPEGARYSEQLRSKHLTLSLQHVTIREVLDAIVLAHGGASWVVRYPSAAGEYSGCEIVIVSFEGLKSTLRAHAR